MKIHSVRPLLNFSAKKPKTKTQSAWQEPAASDMFVLSDGQVKKINDPAKIKTPNRLPKKEIKTSVRDAIQVAEKNRIDAEKAFDEVLNLYNKGNITTPDGATLRRIINVDNKLRFMKEFNPDGGLKRFTTFEDGTPVKIVEGHIGFSDGSERTGKEIHYKDGQVTFYQEDYSRSKDGSFRAALEIHYKDETPVWYKESCENGADGSSSQEKEIIFDPESGKPTSYQQGYSKASDGTWGLKKQVIFDEGKPIYYAQDTFRPAEGVGSGICMEKSCDRWVFIS